MPDGHDLLRSGNPAGQKDRPAGDGIPETTGAEVLPSHYLPEHSTPQD
ncbi:MAG TPA: hypothetical protein VMY37_15015 [Thermoguttaceae bacterium]|nr:hypothetical protein [Thermoguttaceae bacterium]